MYKSLFHGKAKDMTPKEIILSWKFGGKMEELESVDFSKN